MTFGYKIMGSIHRTFGSALMVLSAENSSSAEDQALVHKPCSSIQMCTSAETPALTTLAYWDC